MHGFELCVVLFSCFNEINAGGVDAAVAQKIGQLGEVAVKAVVNHSEEVPEVVREDLPRLDAGCSAETLHLCPELCAP